MTCQGMTGAGKGMGDRARRTANDRTLSGIAGNAWTGNGTDIAWQGTTMNGRHGLDMHGHARTWQDTAGNDRRATHGHDRT